MKYWMTIPSKRSDTNVLSDVATNRLKNSVSPNFMIRLSFANMYAKLNEIGLKNVNSLYNITDENIKKANAVASTLNKKVSSIKIFTKNIPMIFKNKNHNLSNDMKTPFLEKTKVNSIFYEGQIYDSFSLLLDIFKSAKKEITIVDNYAGKELLDILRKIDRSIVIVSKNIDNTLKNKYEGQYNNVTFINNISFHDRFIIIDRKKLYCCGASFKDLGKKCFAISEFNDQDYLDKLLKTIYNK